MPDLLMLDFWMLDWLGARRTGAATTRASRVSHLANRPMRIISQCLSTRTAPIKMSHHADKVIQFGQ